MPSYTHPANEDYCRHDEIEHQCVPCNWATTIPARRERYLLDLLRRVYAVARENSLPAEESDEIETVLTVAVSPHEPPTTKVHAIQFTGTGESHLEVEEWAADLISRGLATSPRPEGSSVFWGDCHGLYVDTPEGRLHAAPGDYMVCDERGMFYRVKQADYQPSY